MQAIEITTPSIVFIVFTLRIETNHYMAHQTGTRNVVCLDNKQVEYLGRGCKTLKTSATPW